MNTDSTRRTKKELWAENARLRQMVKDTIWMARRYADGRSTYAPGVVNAAIDDALGLGILVTPDATLEDRLYARDGMFGDWVPPARCFARKVNPEGG